MYAEIDTMDLLNDFHIHTIYSNHSHPTMTVPNILAAAREAGLKEIIVLEHIPPIGSPQPTKDWYARRNQRESLDLIHAELKESEALFPSLKVWRGAEVDADPFQTDGTLMLQDTTGLDVVLGATHVLPGGANFWFEPFVLTPEQGWEMATRWRDWALQLVYTGRIQVLAHPCDMLGARQLTPPFDSAETLTLMDPLLRAMSECKVAFELNELLGAKLLLAYRSSYVRLVQSARDLGVTFSVASDAHQPDRVGQFLWIRQLISDANLTADSLWAGPGAG
jgi:HisJ family histidinol phosphate phosphatase